MPSGSRVRSNNAFGAITDNPLSAGATSFNSAALILLPAISAGQHTVIVLDPKRVFGEPEIVIVTAHTGLSTAATITRAAYGTIARSHPVNTVWAHVAVNEDYTQVLSSTTRPTDPYLGQSIFETDTLSLKRYNGSSWNSSPPVGSLIAFAGSAAPSGYLMAQGQSVLRTDYPDLFLVIGITYGSVDITHFTIPNLKGNVPVGLDAAQAEFDVLGDTGGVKAVTLTQNQLAQHLHGITDPQHAHGVHTHGQTDHDHGISVNNHSASSDGDGAHAHTPLGVGSGDWAVRHPGAANGIVSSPAEKVTFTSMVGVGNHSHVINVSGHVADVFPAPANLIQASVPNSSVGFTSTNNTGINEAHQNLPPYITVNYIIKY